MCGRPQAGESWVCSRKGVQHEVGQGGVGGWVRGGGLLEDAGEMSGGEASGAFILGAGDPCTILRAGM